MTTEELFDEIRKLAKTTPITRDAARRFGELVDQSPEQIEIEVGDMIEVFIRNAMKQEDGEELVDIANNAA